MENFEEVTRDTNTVGDCYRSCEKEEGYLASNFSGLEAGSADVLTLGVSVNQGADALNIRIPATTGTTV